MTTRRDEAGVTLVELLVMLLILAIVGTIALAFLTGPGEPEPGPAEPTSSSLPDALPELVRVCFQDSNGSEVRAYVPRDSAEFEASYPCDPADRD